LKADYFINSEPSDLNRDHECMPARSPFVIELTGNTRHLSKREEAGGRHRGRLRPRSPTERDDVLRRRERGAPVESIGSMSASCMARSRQRAGTSGAAPQVADFVRIKGWAAMHPGQTKSATCGARHSCSSLPSGAMHDADMDPI